MRFIAFIMLFSTLLIGMFIYLDQGGARKDEILSDTQKAKLKEIMKPPH